MWDDGMAEDGPLGQCQIVNPDNRQS